jgi:hypothetical protein
MKTLHPRIMYTLPCGGVQREGTLSTGSGEVIPPAGGFGGKQAPDEGLGETSPNGGSRSKPRRKNFLVNVYCNFILKMDLSL